MRSTSTPPEPEAKLRAWMDDVTERLRALEVGNDNWKGGGDWVDTTDVKSTTSASFVVLWKGWIERVETNAFQIRFDYEIDASTTGSFQVRIDGSTTSPIKGPVSAGTGTAVLKWLHGLTIGDTPHYVEIMARRDTGSNSVKVTHPYSLVQRSGVGAANDGTAWS